ncbi:helix-turn-helix domain-containing protein [Marisediminicola senii]|uniref:helix-turn-helix domain-containing protein n=1 Tax=Marisediminicola senii TaxID=2711233 RepID=UPI0019120546|nr:helix-turn-helix transcriptional regulator [Marisediminicola senii]
MRVIGYEWRLREVMAAAGIFSTTKLVPLLRERGIDLSTSQIFRLVTEKPERLNMHVLVALMDIFDCSADDLVGRVNMGAAATNAATGTESVSSEQGTARLRESGLRPKRAEILPRDA